MWADDQGSAARWIRPVLLCPLLLLLLACGGDPQPKPLNKVNVIVVVFDTTRFDDWSILEPDRRVTPRMDEIAAKGQRFTSAHSLYSVTVPSHVSLFTGHATLEPVDHALAADGGGQEKLSDPRFGYRASSLFTILSDHGYRTYSFAGNYNVRRANIEALDVIDAGSKKRPKMDAHRYYKYITKQYGAFQKIQEFTRPGQWHVRRRNRRLISRNAEYIGFGALRTMRQHAAEYAHRPYFLFLNFNDAHDPYFPDSEWGELIPSPPESDFNGDLWSSKQREGTPRTKGLDLSMSSFGLSEADIERARSLHLGEVAYADHHFGKLLDQLEALGLLENTIIVGTADHGEAFGEGGRMAHGGWGGDEVLEALLHVPLFMHFPDSKIPPAILEERVDLRDIKPTILDFIGIPDDSSGGRSLLPLIRGEVDALPEANIRPQDESPEAIGNNLIGGQDDETSSSLEEELKALGYIE